MHSRTTRSNRYIMAVISCMMVIGAIICPPNWTMAAAMPYNEPTAVAAPVASFKSTELISTLSKFDISYISAISIVHESIKQRIDATKEEVVTEKITAAPVEEVVTETPPVIEKPAVVESTPVQEATPEVVKEPIVEQVNSQYDYSAIPLSEAELQSVIDGSARTGIPIPVILGVIDNESGFDSTARNSYTGCYGYMQLHPKYFPTGLSPADNITYGINYLAENFSACGGNMVKALDMYHCGHVTGDTYYPNRILTKAAYWSEVTGIPM